MWLSRWHTKINDVILGTEYSWRLSFPRLRLGKDNINSVFPCYKGILRWCAKGIVILFYALSAPILYTSSAKEITGDTMGTANWNTIIKHIILIVIICLFISNRSMNYLLFLYCKNKMQRQWSVQIVFWYSPNLVVYCFPRHCQHRHIQAGYFHPCRWSRQTRTAHLRQTPNFDMYCWWYKMAVCQFNAKHQHAWIYCEFCGFFACVEPIFCQQKIQAHSKVRHRLLSLTCDLSLSSCLWTAFWTALLSAFQR